jgi:hypothetical protein
MKQNEFLTNTVKEKYFCPEPSDKHLVFQKMLDHLIHMALMKGWKEHTWWRVKQLENDPSGLWKGIQAEFLKEIENAKRQVRIDEEQQTNRNALDTKA